jgi:hypothetical protein
MQPKLETALHGPHKTAFAVVAREQGQYGGMQIEHSEEQIGKREERKDERHSQDGSRRVLQ